MIAVALALAALAVSLAAFWSARDRHVAAAATAGGDTLAGPAPTHPIALRILEGRARRRISDDTREYALRISLAQPAGAPPAHARDGRDRGAGAVVDRIALRVTYRTRANFLGAVDLEPDPDLRPAENAEPALTLPVSLSHTPQAGWLFFRTSNIIPRHCRVSDYALVAMTASGERTLVDASLPALLAADTDGIGPATWGWD